LVANTGLKVDLHIHSVYSKHKDGNKVNNNTHENIGVLIEKLNLSGVNICAITDHDLFNYDLYKELKKAEEENGSIQKVLPGVEFSVQFNNGTEDKTIHIVNIFDDQDEEKIKKIEIVLRTKYGHPQYDRNDAYSEDKYVSILREIDIDTIMIAHQKNTLTSTSKPKKNDALTLGKEKFNELLFTEYFEAFEFRNKKNDMFNKKYIFSNGVENDLRFITGSDCHDWTVYPMEDSLSKTDYSFTYVKCIPSFKGLVMAMTDHRRIKLVNSFFNPNALWLDKIELAIANQKIVIPMSKGINVIIGDNSVGKSLLLHQFTAYVKLPSNSPVKRGYKKYLDDNKVSIKTTIQTDKTFRFDAQGEVRKLFEENKIKGSEFFKPYFPEDINSNIYRSEVEQELENYYKCIQQKFDYDEMINKLVTFKIIEGEQSENSITFIIDTLKPVSSTSIEKLINDLKELEIAIKRVGSSKSLLKSDLKIIEKYGIKVKEMVDKYSKQLQEIKKENKKINYFKTCVKNYKNKYRRQISDEEKVKTEFLENRVSVIDDIAHLISEKVKIREFIFNLKAREIPPNINPVNKYNFISKLCIDEIPNQYVKNVINRVLKKGKSININTITTEKLKQYISHYPPDADQSLAVLKVKITECIDRDFTPKYSIIENGMDKYKELSAGFNSQIFFTLLSGETKNKGIYIIDQPEDNISQKAIGETVLSQFKQMSENRQVIMVTHNPQFIVNLDVDNVIFLSKEDGNFCVKSGALEYENDQYSILKLIADNIDGGLDTISRRMKRYEKGIQL